MKLKILLLYDINKEIVVILLIKIQNSFSDNYPVVNEE